MKLPTFILFLAISFFMSCKSISHETVKENEISNEALDDGEIHDEDSTVLESLSTDKLPDTKSEREYISAPSDDSAEDYLIEDTGTKRSPSRPATLTGGEVSGYVSSARQVATSEGKRVPLDKGQILNLEAGQITAAEWNDLNHWEAWKELLKNQDYNDMQEYWQIYPRSRYTILVKNNYELPLQDLPVVLTTSDGKILWSARTDNSGKAELWAYLFNSDRYFEPVDMQIKVGDKIHHIKDAMSIEEGVNHLTVNQSCLTPNAVDVVFAVDATGSMSDEIRYLQAELEDVMTRSIATQSGLKLRTGAIFYRDNGDEYVTNVQPLSDNSEQTLLFIGEQFADGGGDYPEAVDEAFREILAQDWSENAIARIVFLLLDAPPHYNNEVLEKLKGQIQDLASEGIKVIPITASGINRQTEFLMKFVAMATNGTYIFITDHSGIGNPHLDPVVKDYEVEKLNHLMVRLLYHYTKSNGCEPNQVTASRVSIYPNPTSNYIHIESKESLKQINVLSNSGLLLDSQADLPPGDTKIELGSFIDGIYTVQCIGADFEYSQPVVLISG